MAYRGRYQLGQEVPLSVQCQDGNGAPSLPTRPVRMKVWSGLTIVVNKDIPVHDRYGTTGYFHYRQFLGAAFSTGEYTVTYYYQNADGYEGLETDKFEILAGGHSDGSIIAMAYYTRPHADFVVTHLDSGKIQQRRNPSV